MQKKVITKAEKYKRKMKIRRIVSASILGLIVILCVCLFTPVFGVTEISIEGNSVMKTEEIASASNIKIGQNIFRINIKKTEEKLMHLPYVEEVKIVRKFPAKIKILISESKEDIIIDTPTEFVITTIDGKVLFKTIDVTELPIPIVKGIDVKSSEVGQKIVSENFDFADKNMSYIKCFYKSDYWSEIDAFDIADQSNFMMIMRSGMRVTFGPVDTIESLQRKINMMDAIIPQIKPTERSYLDLTTDKGYFGTYTVDEYENIKKLREEGELIKKLTEENETTEEDKKQESENAEKSQG